MFWCLASVGATAVAAAARVGGQDQRESYVAVPMPQGFRVEPTELHGPVFADEKGRTLYKWPSKGMRNGVAGEDKGKPICDNVRVTETAGLMSIYPAGLELPDLDTRPTCTDVWPPVLAVNDAKPVGEWTIVTRKDGAKQWAYQGQALYTSILDRLPGDTMGTVVRQVGRDDGAARLTVGPPPDVPPGFDVKTTYHGRLLLGPKGMSAYSWNRDTAAKSNCVDTCLEEWEPLLAAGFFRAHGDWSLVERSSGIRQIAFRGKPLYLHRNDREIESLEGADVPGWRNVYTQVAPSPPHGFTAQNASHGQVLADAQGRTVYAYNCDEDTVDQLSCDNPGATQVYRFAICGRGDPARCLERWPYVTASASDRSISRTWSVIDIDPNTGRLAQAGAPGAMRVWAYRNRPIYRYFRDSQPGDVMGNGLGEVVGYHNGYRAFLLRDAF